jgi:hypothetical protein
LHPILKPIVGVFALIGVAYCAFAVYANLFLMDCVFSSTAQAISPNGEYFGVYEQRICRDPDKSTSQVLIGKRGSDTRSVLLELRGTSDVRLTWSSDRELVVSYPRSAAVIKQYGMDFEWGRVTLRPADSAAQL